MGVTVSSVNTDVSKRLDITCRKGDTFNLVINITDAAGAVVDLSSYSFKMEVRESDTSSTSVITGGQFTINGTSLGVLTINCPSSIMDDVASGMYTYDFQTTLAGIVQTWLYGVFIVNEDVTE